MTYVTCDEVKAFSKLKREDLDYETEAEFESYIDTLIPLAEGMIDSFCHVPRGFFADSGMTFTNSLHDYRATWIHLKYKPVLSISKVEVDTSTYGDDPSWTELSENTGYVCAKERGLLKIVGDTVPSEMLQTIRVAYTAGYSSCPQTIEFVALQLISNIMHEMHQRKLSPLVRTDDYQIRLVVPKAFTPELQQDLAPYVNRQVLVG